VDDCIQIAPRAHRGKNRSHHLPNGVPVEEHRQHGVCSRSGVRSRRRHSRSSGECLGTLRRPVPHAHLEARLNETVGHRRAHCPQAQDGNGSHDFWLFHLRALMLIDVIAHAIHCLTECAFCEF
jgi:hypothetical protein